jgi:hypothetical protein
MIGSTTLSDLIMRNTDTKDMQQNAFIATERHLSNVAAGDPSVPQLIIGVDAPDAVIAGGPADDTLVAGLGDHQTLTGGGGANLFIFDGTSHTATITDFNVRFDQIEFHGDATGGSSATIGNVAGGNSELTFNGNTITLVGVHAPQLHQSNLIFLDSNALITNHTLT